MQENNEQIFGGAFSLARQIFNSEVWLEKPSSWNKIWIYILGKVNHKDDSKFKRGEGFFNFRQEVKNIGIDITSDKIKKFLAFARGRAMISTTKSTKGITIKVLMYNKYQDLNNYTSTTKSTLKAPRKHHESTTINKNDKNDKNDKNILQPAVAEEIIYEPENSEAKKTLNKQIFGLMAKFRDYNPVIKINHKTHRKSCEDLINQFGYEKALNIVKYALALQGRQFVPTITTPTQLINKLGDLKVYAERQKAQTPTIVKI